MEDKLTFDDILNPILNIILGILILTIGYLSFMVCDLYLNKSSDYSLSGDVSESELEEINDLAKEIARIRTSKVMYQTSIELMEMGYYNTRPEYTIEDEEYQEWRSSIIPVMGASIGAPTLIEITAASGNIEAEVCDYVADCVNLIPEDFIRKCAADGWKIKIVDSSSLSDKKTDKYSDMNVDGQTNYITKTISIDASAPESIFHEFGHVLAFYAEDELKDAGLYDFSTENELDALYNHNIDGSVYIYMNPEEQIAQSFYDYLFYPRELNDQAPTLYRIFDNTIKTFADAA